MRSNLIPCVAVCAGIALGACTLPTRSPHEEARDSLAATEREFARYSIQYGIRAAFIEYFADDGINFQPGPVNTREAFIARPPSDPSKVVLDWHPVLVDVSGAGDLGFSIGPSTFTDRRGDKPEVHTGIYFSVWRRQTDASWRVVIDGGVETPGAAPDSAFGDGLRIHTTAQTPGLAQAAGTLVALETRPPFRAAGPAPAAEYAAMLSADARLFIDSSFPVIGRDAVAGYFASRVVSFAWHPIAERVSRSADLAYTYGTVHFDISATRAVDGHYVHLWLRDGLGEWKLAIDLVLLPPGVASLDP